MGTMNRDHRQCLSHPAWQAQVARRIARQKAEAAERRRVYDLNPRRCVQCRAPLDYDKPENKYCSRSCAAVFNNALKHGPKKSVPSVSADWKPSATGVARVPREVRKTHPCINCGADCAKTFCSQKCSSEHRHKAAVEKWKAGKDLAGTAYGGLKRYVRSYLLAKYDNKCSRCGWCEPNVVTGKPPLEVEHIDGNSGNNAEDNLTILCPNCHAITPTYKGLNRGKGRHKRMARYNEGKSF